MLPVPAAVSAPGIFFFAGRRKEEEEEGGGKEDGLVVLNVGARPEPGRSQAGAKPEPGRSQAGATTGNPKIDF